MIPGWSATDMNTMRAWYGHTPTDRLAKQLRRTPDEIDAAAVALGLRAPAVRELSESAKVVDVYLRDGILVPMPKPARKVKAKPAPKPRPEPKPKKPPAFEQWAPEDEAALARLYPFCMTRDLEARFGRSEYCIAQKAHRMGLKKDPVFLNTLARQRALNRRASLIESLRSAKDHLSRGDHITALSLIDQAIGRVGVA